MPPSFARRRVERIARGSGRHPAQVELLVHQYRMMKSMSHKMGKAGMISGGEGGKQAKQMKHMEQMVKSNPALRAQAEAMAKKQGIPFPGSGGEGGGTPGGFDMNSMMQSMMGANGGKGIPGMPQLPPGMTPEKMMEMMGQGGMGGIGGGGGGGARASPGVQPDFSQLEAMMGDMD